MEEADGDVGQEVQDGNEHVAIDALPSVLSEEQYGEEQEGIEPEQEDEVDSSSGVAGEDDKMDEEDKGMHDTPADAQLEKPLTNVQYCANSLNAKHGRSISSACWEVIKRLKDVTLTGVKKEGQTTTQWTHVCIICWRLLRLTYHQHKKVWLTTQATTHIKKFGCHQKARLSFKHKDNTKQQRLMLSLNVTGCDTPQARCSAARIYNGTE